MPNVLFQVQVGASVPLFSSKTLSTSQETEILPGERYEVLDGLRCSWVRVRTALDSYEGYIHMDHHTLRASKDLVEATHMVNVAMANVYRCPTFKSVAVHALPFNARVRACGVSHTSEGVMVKIAEGRWIFRDQLRNVGECYNDFVEACLVLNGQPYTWGGRNGGWDCSGAMQAGGIAFGLSGCERDVGPQSRTLGKEIDLEHALAVPQRGDLFFWTELKGRHVAVMVDRHSAFHFSIENRIGVVESLEHIIAAQARGGNGRPTVARRVTKE